MLSGGDYIPVCRLCNARLAKALTVSIGQWVKVVCPNCKSEEVYDDFPTPAEQRKKYRECIEMIKDDE